jgi:RNA polymerase sigma-70 factor, ECF subfamily
MARPKNDTATAGGVPSADAEYRMRKLYEESVENLFRYLLRLTLGRRHLAEDLLQETYLRAWRNLYHLPTEPAKALPWLFTVARHVAIDAARAREARPVEVGAFNLGGVPTTDNLAERVVDVQIVRTALSRLSRQHREVLFEVFFRDATAQDIAQRLGIPVGTVRSRTFYALRSLRALFGEVRTGSAAWEDRPAQRSELERPARSRDAVKQG